jgi:hypothetical protein
MPDIVLATFCARFSHPALGLRYLMANLGPLAERAVLREFVSTDWPADVAEKILQDEPAIVGLSVYVWNARQSAELVSILKGIRPDLVIVLGGPEVSHEFEDQPIFHDADFLIRGEGDVAFAALAARLLAGEPGGPKVQHGGLPDLAQLTLPYDLYTDADLAHRAIYVEASRGCPFQCSFCLSALDVGVRKFPLPALLDALDQLFQRGCRQFRFVDRTFNLDLKVGEQLLRFFLDRLEPGLFLHFEVVPHRMPPHFRALLAQFPPGTIQFEVGFQTFAPPVAKQIKRALHARADEILKELVQETGVHIHADLVVGLPGETFESFGVGFDRLHALGPHEVQVGMLKRLRGAPIVHDQQAFAMVFDRQPPYEVLQTSTLSFAELRRLRRFSRYLDLTVNNGHFPRTVALLSEGRSPFAALMQWSDWLYARVGKAHGISLARLAELLRAYLVSELEHEPNAAAQVVMADFTAGGRRRALPSFGQSKSGAPKRARNDGTTAKPTLPPRQARRQAEGNQTEDSLLQDREPN